MAYVVAGVSEKEIVGHKTFVDEHGAFSHEPLSREEADAVWSAVIAAKEAREEQMPDEQSAIQAIWDAYQRLQELGWRPAIYCPKDGSLFDAIEVGSTGIHKCSYQGEWPEGSFWIHSHGDMWPSRPILYRREPPKS